MPLLYFLNISCWIYFQLNPNTVSFSCSNWCRNNYNNRVSPLSSYVLRLNPEFNFNLRTDNTGKFTYRNYCILYQHTVSGNEHSFLTLQFVFCMNTPNNNKICSLFLDYSTQQGCFGFGINNHYNLNFLQISGALTAYKICCSAFMPLFTFQILFRLEWDDHCIKFHHFLHILIL